MLQRVRFARAHGPPWSMICPAMHAWSSSLLAHEENRDRIWLGGTKLGNFTRVVTGEVTRATVRAASWKFTCYLRQIKAISSHGFNLHDQLTPEFQLK
jgi:hypothetical protein